VKKLVHANDVGNVCLAIAAGFSAYGLATNDVKIAAVSLPLGLALKAAGSYISDHYQKTPATQTATPA
jgi:hypothetical protein